MIEAATRANLWKEFRKDRWAMNLQTGYTHIYVSTATSPLRKAAESGSEPGLAGEEDASLQQSGCLERGVNLRFRGHIRKVYARHFNFVEIARHRSGSALCRSVL